MAVVKHFQDGGNAAGAESCVQPSAPRGGTNRPLLGVLVYESVRLRDGPVAALA